MAAAWHIESKEVAFASGQPDIHEQLSPRLLQLILEKRLADKVVLDIGCGKGRLALALAPHSLQVVGIDRDQDEISRAQALVGNRGITNVIFITADAEEADYLSDLGLSRVDMVVANLCMSQTIMARSARAIEIGRPFIFSAFHTDQWKETGRPSRFAFSQEQMETSISRAGFRPEYLGLEREVITFSSQEEALHLFLAVHPLKERWAMDGRLTTLESYFRGGGRKFTARSHILVKARRAA